MIIFHFRNQKSITFFVTFTNLLIDSRLCLPFSNGNALNLKKKSQVKPRKIKTEREQTLRLFPEYKQKNSKTNIKVLTTFITLKNNCC